MGTGTSPFSEGNYEQMRFRKQWAILQSNRSTGFASWKRVPLTDAFALHCHPELRVERKTEDGKTVYLLGTAIYTPAPQRSPLEALGALDDSRIIDWVIHLSGTYVVIFSENGGIRIYTDPAAMMGVYYDGAAAASSPGLLPDLKRDEAVDRDFPLTGADDWYPGSLCPYVGVKALLANHRLDFPSGRRERFWPSAEFKRYTRAEAVDEAARLHRNIVLGLIGKSPCLFSLTGGKETRLNLSALKGFEQEVEFFTIKAPGTRASDYELPARLAEKFGLNHRIVEYEPTPAWLFSLYDEIGAGMSIGSRRDIIGTCLKLSGPDYMHVSGVLGDYLKTQFWPSKNPTRLTKAPLMNEFVNKAGAISRAIDEWIATLPPGIPVPTAYDLMYFEQRGGRWGGLGETCSALFYTPCTPYNSRDVFEVVQGMPRVLARDGAFHVDMVRTLWPELLEVPYQTVPRRIGVHLPKGLKYALKRLLGRA
jgi:hypothetical protein